MGGRQLQGAVSNGCRCRAFFGKLKQMSKDMGGGKPGAAAEGSGVGWCHSSVAGHTCCQGLHKQGRARERTALTPGLGTPPLQKLQRTMSCTTPPRPAPATRWRTPRSITPSPASTRSRCALRALCQGGEARSPARPASAPARAVAATPAAPAALLAEPACLGALRELAARSFTASLALTADAAGQPAGGGAVCVACLQCGWSLPLAGTRPPSLPPSPTTLPASRWLAGRLQPVRPDGGE